jgi:hypothetical protein
VNWNLGSWAAVPDRVPMWERVNTQAPAWVVDLRIAQLKRHELAWGNARGAVYLAPGHIAPRRQLTLLSCALQLFALLHKVWREGR